MHHWVLLDMCFKVSLFVLHLSGAKAAIQTKLVMEMEKWNLHFRTILSVFCGYSWDDEYFYHVCTAYPAKNYCSSNYVHHPNPWNICLPILSITKIVLTLLGSLFRARYMNIESFILVNCYPVETVFVTEWFYSAEFRCPFNSISWYNFLDI